jgi:hypothetical protein
MIDGTRKTHRRRLRREKSCESKTKVRLMWMAQVAGVAAHGADFSRA